MTMKDTEAGTQSACDLLTVQCTFFVPIGRVLNISLAEGIHVKETLHEVPNITRDLRLPGNVQGAAPEVVQPWLLTAPATQYEHLRRVSPEAAGVGFTASVPEATPPQRRKRDANTTA